MWPVAWQPEVDDLDEVEEEVKEDEEDEEDEEDDEDDEGEDLGAEDMGEARCAAMELRGNTPLDRSV